MTQEKSVDEVFGEYWHLDWQDLPDTCKAWLIEKSAACGSDTPQEKTIDKVFGESRHVDWSTILEKDWNQHRQTLTQLNNPKHTNIRRQKVEMLLWQNRVRTPEQKEADEQELDQTLRAHAKENGNLKKNKPYRRLGIDLENVTNIRPASMTDYDRQIVERTRLDQEISIARAPLTAAAKRKKEELLGIYVGSEPELKSVVSVGDKQSTPTDLQAGIRTASVTKQEKSAFMFGRAYQIAVNDRALSDPMTAAQQKTAVAAIRRALDKMGLKLGDTKISSLVKQLLIN